MRAAEFEEVLDNLVVIDFETYYAPDYTLSKMTTTDYIRDPRFEVIGVGVFLPSFAEPVWMEHAKFLEFVAGVPWENRIVLAHNTPFDGFILSDRYNVHPGYLLDTLSMGRALHGTEVGNSLKRLMEHYAVGVKGDEVVKTLGKHRKDFTTEEWLRFGEYCKGDVMGCLRVFCKMIEGSGYPDAELDLIDTTIRMYTEPVLRLDSPLMEGYLKEEKTRKEALLAACASAKEDLMSNQKFATKLMELGVVPPMKWSAKQECDIYAFAKSDAGMQALLEDESPEVRALAEARIGVKSTINETRTERLLRLGKDGAPLPVYLKYSGAHTHRWSGGDRLNWQNFQCGGTIRDAIEAPQGYMLVVSDSAQIEARVTAWLAKHSDLVQAFAEGRDVYSEFASNVYGRRITKEQENERFVGKVCVAEGTPVLTERGWLPIETLDAATRVWDGTEWVAHLGLLDQGEREVWEFSGVAATPDHEILTGRGWREWSEVLTSPSLFQSALSLASLEPETPLTNAVSPISKRLSRTYDLASCGPRSRFVIWSARGPLVVHNCILGLGYGMGWMKFAATLAAGARGGPRIVFTAEDAEKMGVQVGHFAADTAKTERVEKMPSLLPVGERITHAAVCDFIVKRYRRENAPIPALWREMEDVLVGMSLDEADFPMRGGMRIVRHGIVLPSGLVLKYRGLEGSREDGWSYVGSGYSKAKSYIYGGLLTENIVQALARCIVADQMQVLREMGYRVVMMTHDEVVLCVEEGKAEAALETAVGAMKVPPKWAPDLPLSAEGGIGKKYGSAK